MAILQYDDTGRLMLPKGYLTPEKHQKIRDEKKQMKKKEYSYNYYHKFDTWQQKSLINGIRPENDLASYTDDEIIEILKCNSNNYQEILRIALKLKRTWWGIRIIIKEKEYYIEHGRIQKLFWLPPKNDENKLAKLEKQIKKIVDNL